MFKLAGILVCLFALQVFCRAQDSIEELPLTLQDTLRGSITPERAWWDVTKYDITVQPDFLHKTIKGTNIISLKATAEGKRMQIDMQEPMKIIAANVGEKKIEFTRNGNVYYLDFDVPVKKGESISLKIEFNGSPREATNPPWDGGWIWKTDSRGNPWMSAACQLLGASSWYPCKDYQGDEPDSASLTIIVPDTLVAVGNGRLRNKSSSENGWQSYTWAVVNPINNYNIIPYIGKYVNWTETYNGEKGKLALSYWVLEQNEKKARIQFKQVPKMLKCFEHWFGPYPFYEDGYKLVESPHLGMEHQSAVAYGNKFENGYLGTDLSGTGWGLKWDFIIVHESGHEWFANSITTKDVADLWVHEGFTNYSEVLYTECEFGKEAGNEYCIGLRKKIANDKPVIGPYGVNREGSVDMYYKGSNLLHTIRQIINDDEKFRSILRGMNKDFYHQTVTSKLIEDYITKKAGIDLSKVFDQYLRNINIPIFEYKFSNGKLSYRWSNCIDGFDMPIKINASKPIWLYPSTQWKSIKLNKTEIQADPNFYVGSRKL
jgi:aminopeptidase N